ncbi:DUF2735 domain-containing protein [Methylobacterium sp. Leaf108]|uniref:DUF2735 domain-containing protein n=1 Tax=Methylobacterium sp. Leaf108 TaxID=1736256 RepID=UPI0006F23759|nr:DUF2735 domain-containing protein [Methylobacterium sp. Leaf108]KQP50537.1 hypothetical protein ASF39_12665 [Methylobacterium sp. Leaf108]
MTISNTRETAKIYAFVPRTRATGSGQPSGLKSGSAQDAQQVPVCDFSGSWYHAAAIQDAPQPRRS